MKNVNTKLVIMFVAGMLFSMIAVFAVTITVPTDFTSDTVQYLQKIVLKDASNNTGVIINGSGVEKLEVNGKVKIGFDYLSPDSIDLIGGIKMNGTSIWGISNYGFGIVGQSGGMFISTGGNIGIGTDSPQEKLHVIGSLRTNGSNFSNGIELWNDPSTDKFHIIHGRGNISWEMGESYDLGGSGMLSIGTRTNNPIGIFVDDNELIHLSNDGNVGIGINDPKVKLDVDGYIKVGVGVSPSDCIDDMDGAIRFNEDDGKFQGCISNSRIDLH